MSLIRVWVSDLKKKLRWLDEKLIIFPCFNFCIMIRELWNIYGSNEMTSLNNIFFRKYLSLKIHFITHCFNHHISHAVLLQSIAKWTWTFQLFIKILTIVSKFLLAIRKHKNVANMILKKVFFPKSNKISK